MKYKVYGEIRKCDFYYNNININININESAKNIFSTLKLQANINSFLEEIKYHIVDSFVKDDLLFEFESNKILNIDDKITYKNKKYRIYKVYKNEIYINFSQYCNLDITKNFQKKIDKVNLLINEYNETLEIINKLS